MAPARKRAPVVAKKPVAAKKPAAAKKAVAAKKPVADKSAAAAKKPIAAKRAGAAKKSVAAKKPAAKEEAAAPSPQFQRVVSALTAHRDVSVWPGWSAGSLVLKTGDKMFAMCIRGELVVKLPRAVVDQLVSGGEAQRFDPKRNGRVMKEWAVLPPATATAGRWSKLAAEARAFVQGAAGAR